MYCRECGKEIDDNAAFCTYCGKPTVNAGAATYVIPNGSEDKRKIVKNIIWIGIIVIVIMVVIVFMLAAAGTANKVTDTTEGTANKVADTAGETTNKAADTAEPITETSALNDIIGDWQHELGIMSDTYATNFERVGYLRVEAEGIMAIGGDINTRFYAIGVDDITIQEENGIKYYTYSAEMYTTLLEQGGGSGRQVIGIRLYLDEVSGWLVCEINTPGDGFWQIVDAYKLMDISIEEHFEKLGTGAYRAEREALEEALKEKYFSTLEEALSDDDFRNRFEYTTGVNEQLLTRTVEYNADGNRLILDVKLRGEESPDSVFISFYKQDRMNDWISEWSEMVDEQNGSNPITVTVRCLSSDGKESAERTYVRETRIETLEKYYSDPARVATMVNNDAYRWGGNGYYDDFNGFETGVSLDVTGNDMVVTIQYQNLDSSRSQDFASIIYERLETRDDIYTNIVNDMDTIVNEPGACTYTIRFTDPNNVVFAEKTYRENRIETLEEYYAYSARADAAVRQELDLWRYVENEDFIAFGAVGWLDATGNDVVVTIHYEDLNLDSSPSQDIALLFYEYLESWDNRYTDIVNDLDTIVNEPGACTYTIRFVAPNNTVFAERTYSNR